MNRYEDQTHIGPTVRGGEIPTSDVGPDPIRQFVFSIRETPNGCEVTVVTPKGTRTKRFIKKGAFTRARNWIREQHAAILEMVEVDGLPMPEIIVPYGIIDEPRKRMSGDQLRVKFEQWATGELMRLNTSRFHENHTCQGKYISHETAAAWSAWRQAFHVAKNE